MGAGELAKKRFIEEKYHCAESVFLGVAETLGRDPWVHLPLITPFGGGIAGLQGICGAVTGGLFAIGLFYGRKDSAGSRKEADDAAKEFLAFMEKLHGTTICRELTGADLSDPKQKAEFQKPGGGRERVCAELVAKASDFLVEMITQSGRP